jgi:CheY-like chemotaxis protein
MAKGVDVVVTDYNMPGFDGLELADQIKQRWPNLPVVIVTGYPGVEMASRHEVLDKGIDVHVIVGRICELARGGS